MKIADALMLRVHKIDGGYTRAHIVLGAHSKEGSDVLLSNDCRSAVEVREQADRLVRQLQKMKTEAEKIDWKGIPKRR